jgi:cytochrome c
MATLQHHKEKCMSASKFYFTAAALAALSVLPLTAQADLKLATSKGCTACHQIEKMFMGPAYKEVAAKYKADPKGEATMVNSILKGSTGKWKGKAMTEAMPANKVSEAEAKTLAKWILSL